MPARATSSHVSAPNSALGTISDEDLLRGFLLSLGASGRREKTQTTYEESIRMLSEFAESVGFPGLAKMDRNVVRHWLTSVDLTCPPSLYHSLC